MSGPELCPKCKGLHFKTAPCIVRNNATARVGGLREVTLPSTGKDTALSGAGRVPVTLSESASGSSPEVATTPPKRPVGRPKTITDMKAYKAERARKYRADKKAAKDATPPKPSIQTTTEERNEE